MISQTGGKQQEHEEDAQEREDGETRAGHRGGAAARNKEVDLDPLRSVFMSQQLPEYEAELSGSFMLK